MATEWTIEARSGGQCVVRVVHSLFASTDEWDDQLESMESGWPGWFRILWLYLAHFFGRPCSAFRVMGVAPEPESKAWDALTGALGLAGATVGQPRKTSAGVPPLAGTVERVGEGRHPHVLILLLDEPAPGIASIAAHAMGGQVYLAMRIYLYGDQAPAVVAGDEPLWQAWIKEHFA